MTLWHYTNMFIIMTDSIAARNVSPRRLVEFLCQYPLILASCRTLRSCSCWASLAICSRLSSTAGLIRPAHHISDAGHHRHRLHLSGTAAATRRYHGDALSVIGTDNSVDWRISPIARCVNISFRLLLRRHLSRRFWSSQDLMQPLIRLTQC